MQDPELYEIQNRMQQEDNEKFLKNHLKLIKWKGEDSIIDIGCGSGNVTKNILLPKLPKNIKILVGVDISNKMIEYASKCNSRRKVEYTTLNIESKEFPEEFKEKFDHAFSFYCINWVQNQRLGWKNINMLLKQGGGIFANFLLKHPFFAIYAKMSQEDKWRLFAGDYRKFATPYQNIDNAEDVIRKHLEETGFKIIRCKAESRKYTYGDIVTTRNFIASVNPFIPRMPEDMIDEYLDDFMIHLKKYNEYNEKNFYSTYRIIEIYAIKK